MVRDRLQLQSDTFALCRAGYIPVTDYFDLLESYKNESEYTVMGDILKNLGEISLLSRNLDEATQGNLKKWKVNFLQNLKTSLGWTKKEDDTHSSILLRSKVMTSLGQSGDPEVTSEAKQMFEDHVAGKKEIPGDLRSAVYITIAANANSTEDISKLTKLWADNKDSQEQQSLVERSIGYVKSPQNIEAVLKFIQNDLKACNVPFAFVGLCYGSTAGAEATWDYIQNNLPHIKETCQGFLLQAMFARTLCVFGTQAKHDEIKKFFDDAKMDVATRAISQMLEKISIRGKMLVRDGASISGYFSG